MKAKLLFFVLIISSLFLFHSSSNSHPKETPFPKPVTGQEVYDVSNLNEIKIDPNYKHRLIIPPVQTKTASALFSPMGVYTVYDLQSNGVPQEIWQDPITPTNVHATFMYSTVAGFPTRACAYFFSSDNGATWTFLGDVPSSGRSGFPAISGFTNGAAIIANHNDNNGTSTRAKLYFDAGPGFGVFSERDPGDSPGGQSIWPRVVGKEMNKMIFATSINGAVLSYTNSYNNGIFSGFVEYPGDQAETYAVALAPNGNIGHAYIGASNGIDDNDVFYRFSTNDGISWSGSQLIWNWNVNTDSLGCLRGVSMVYGNDNQPYVAFNISTLTETGFYPGEPSSIRVWSPNVNGGVAKIIANQNTVPYFPNSGATTDAFLPICRPAIGRSSSGNGLVVAFTATTGQYGSDTSAYYAVWASYTGDGGSSWVAPERLTPSTPLRDWRFVSVSPVNNTNLNQCTAQLTCQSDSLAGTHVNGAPLGRGELVGIRYIFPLNSTPAGPTLLSPSNNSTNISLTPLMDWANVSNADTYRIQVSVNNNFSINVVDQSNLVNSEYQIPASVLINDNTFYWRVNGTNINGVGPWSATFSFSTLSIFPAAPVLTAPLNNSIGNPITPLLDWSNVTGALNYNVQVASDSMFSNLVVNQNSLSSSQYSIPSGILTQSSKYYWRVNAVNINGTGPWSSVWNFSTLGLPIAPVLSVPANGSSQIILTPQLSWNFSPGAASYSLAIATDSNFNNVIQNVSNLSVTIYNVPGGLLVLNTRYYWRVNATNTIGTGPWSLTFNFKTVGPPDAPVLVTPLNNSIGITLTPILDWNNVTGAVSYSAQIATDSNFSNIILSPENFTVSQYIVPAPYLTYFTKYYWRARAVNVNGIGDWSTHFSFTTLQIPPPATPVLLTPSNGSNGISITPLLDWNNVNGAANFRVQISSDLNFTNLVHDQQNILNSEYTVPNGVLSNNTLYFWRVNASNNFGTSGWSAEWVFRTLIIGIENISTGIPENFKLHNNYPNPFNPTTNIEFDLPEASDVEIIVYDFLGKKVKALVNEQLSAGSYRTEFDASSFASGIYFYTFAAGKHRETKRMILIK